jgi:hypothetical protein
MYPLLDPLIEQTSSQQNKNNEWLDGFSALFIYGTGAAGANVYKLLKSKNIVVHGFVDHRNACLWPCGVYLSSRR